jgi:hypothetical protein
LRGAFSETAIDRSISAYPDDNWTEDQRRGIHHRARHILAAIEQSIPDEPPGGCALAILDEARAGETVRWWR